MDDNKQGKKLSIRGLPENVVGISFILSGLYFLLKHTVARRKKLQDKLQEDDSKSLEEALSEIEEEEEEEIFSLFDLPDDLVCDMFYRLPLREVLTLCSLSRGSHAFLSNALACYRGEAMVRMNSRFYKENGPSAVSPAFVAITEVDGSVYAKVYDKYGSTEISQGMETTIVVALSGNGLVWLRTRNSDTDKAAWYITNPSSHAQLEIPEPPHYNPWSSIKKFDAICFDAVNCVATILTTSSPDTFIDLYDTESNAWQTIEMPEAAISMQNVKLRSLHPISVHAFGTLFWLVEAMESSRRVCKVGAFNVAKRSYRCLELPNFICRLANCRECCWYLKGYDGTVIAEHNCQFGRRDLNACWVLQRATDCDFVWCSVDEEDAEYGGICRFGRSLDGWASYGLLRNNWLLSSNFTDLRSRELQVRLCDNQGQLVRMFTQDDFPGRVIDICPFELENGLWWPWPCKDIPNQNQNE